MARIIHRVFVSSTFEDLREERAEVQKALLMLDCFPVGMELFAAADEETWEFIKRQIAESDYYVVIVAGKYGSIAADGISYTEKEYDYAKEIGKPAIAFLHADTDSLPVKQCEADPERRVRLEAFKQKIKPYPVRFFGTPHQLATEVLASIVKLRDSHPRPGFVRADEAADLKRYAELLEEVAKLKDELREIRVTNPLDNFPPPPRMLFRESATSASSANTMEASPNWDAVIIALGDALVLGREWQNNLEPIIAKTLAADGYMFAKRAQFVELIKTVATVGIIESFSSNIGSYWKLTEDGRKIYASLKGRSWSAAAGK